MRRKVNLVLLGAICVITAGSTAIAIADDESPDGGDPGKAIAISNAPSALSESNIQDLLDQPVLAEILPTTIPVTVDTICLEAQIPLALQVIYTLKALPQLPGDRLAVANSVVRQTLIDTTLLALWDPSTRSGERDLLLDELDARANAPEMEMFDLATIDVDHWDKLAVTGATAVAAFTGTITTHGLVDGSYTGEPEQWQVQLHRGTNVPCGWLIVAEGQAEIGG